MAADAIVTGVTRPSADMAFSMYDNQVLAFYMEKFEYVIRPSVDHINNSPPLKLSRKLND